jgi:hypothetical protein
MAHEAALFGLAKPLPDGAAVRPQAVHRRPPAALRCRAPEPAPQLEDIAGRHVVALDRAGSNGAWPRGSCPRRDKA